MDEKKIKELINLLLGLKRYEWLKINAVVNQAYDSASMKIELEDAESLNKMFQLELNNKIVQ